MALTTAELLFPASTIHAPPALTTTASTRKPQHTLPSPFIDSQLALLTQGAEALVYKTTFLTLETPCVVKYRPPKPYRHPILDKRLTRARLLAEARVLVRCKKEGVAVPGILGADWDSGWIVLEWIEGRTIRRVLDEWAKEVKARERAAADEDQNAGEMGEKMLDLMRRVGRCVGRLHEIGVCHGDLTTSNLMLREPAKPPSPNAVDSKATRTIAEKGLGLTGEVTLIDFGLATQLIQDEDRAVDLYVLERAFAATHPTAQPLFQELLRAYGTSYKDAGRVLTRLEDVRLRGRKRSMLG